jgi:hypothetical protein
LEILQPLLVECGELRQGQTPEGIPFLQQGLIEQVTVGFFAGEDIENGCSS